MSEHTPRYESEYAEGRLASLRGLPEHACPYGMAEIGARMSWLAGWADAAREMAA